jgi:hypothetical protein
MELKVLPCYPVPSDGGGGRNRSREVAARETSKAVKLEHTESWAPDRGDTWEETSLMTSSLYNSLLVQ